MTTCRFHSITIVLICLFAFTDIHAGEHPGGMHPAAQLQYVKAQIKKGKEPYVTAYKALLVKADSALLKEQHALADFSVPGYYIKPLEHRKNSLAIQADGFAAYACALAWQLSGQKKYAEKALYFLNAWASLNTTYSDHDGPLVLSYSGTSMVMAAELMRSYKNWNKEARINMDLWIKDVYRKASNEIRERKNNWADWGRFGSLLADAYLEDTADFAINVKLIKADLFDKIDADGHMPEEVRREANGIWYTYFSLAPLTAACWVTYNTTGENLFALQQDGKSIKKALDYLLYYDLHPAEWSWFKNPNVAKAGTATGFWPPNLFEAMYGIYGDDSYRKFYEPYQPLMYDVHHFAWSFSTLMPVRLKSEYK
ncbi:MAG: alginate lyase family protein [Chitinophagaceae bacterium]